MFSTYRHTFPGGSSQSRSISPPRRSLSSTAPSPEFRPRISAVPSRFGRSPDCQTSPHLRQKKTVSWMNRHSWMAGRKLWTQETLRDMWCRTLEAKRLGLVQKRLPDGIYRVLDDPFDFLLLLVGDAAEVLKQLNLLGAHVHQPARRDESVPCNVERNGREHFQRPFCNDTQRYCIVPLCWVTLAPPP